jgi:hypothetical protein
VSRYRGLVRARVAVPILLALAAGVTIVAPAAADSPKFLPDGGKRKILHNGKLAVKVVVYGGSGEVADDAIRGRKPHSGNHFTAVKVGLRNMAAAAYRANLPLVFSIKNDKGQVFRGVPAAHNGLGKVVLKKDQTAYGRLFFELKDGTRLQSVRVRPFGTAGKAAVFVIRGGGNETQASTKPLPGGGQNKVIRSGGKTIKAVLYGASSVPGTAVGAKPHTGKRFVAVKFGIANVGTRPYAVNLASALRITNSNDTLLRPANVARHGLTAISLAPRQTIYGRIFFEVPGKTRLRTVRFKAFGPAAKVSVFTLRSG